MTESFPSIDPHFFHQALNDMVSGGPEKFPESSSKDIEGLEVTFVDDISGWDEENTNMPQEAIRATHLVSVSAALELYPKLIQGICLQWGHPKEFDSYIRKLMLLDRWERQGFKSDVMDELFMLQAMHESVFGNTK